jgi:hypothetical protein
MIRRWVMIGITYDSPLIPENGQPALVVRTANSRHWKRLDWFPRDVWPWWPPQRRHGRLSA